MSNPRQSIVLGIESNYTTTLPMRIAYFQSSLDSISVSLNSIPLTSEAIEESTDIIMRSMFLESEFGIRPDLSDVSSAQEKHIKCPSGQSNFLINLAQL